jgi:hypothetical protein
MTTWEWTEATVQPATVRVEESSYPDVGMVYLDISRQGRREGIFLTEQAVVELADALSTAVRGARCERW